MKAIIKQLNKRRRVYSLETVDTTSFTNFSIKYMTYLSHALMCISISIGKNKEKDPQYIKRKLRFEIDMAMVVSVGRTHFKWAETLKNELESSQWIVQLSEKPPLILPFSYVPRTLGLNPEVKRGNKENAEDAEVAIESDENETMQWIFSLRDLVPGGNEVFSMDELISEVESYVTCLRFKVQVLKSLAYST